MIRSRNKHHFWSQILAGIIAIFLLPATQGFENQSQIETAYQNEQTVQHQVLSVLQPEKTRQVRVLSRQERGERQKFAKIAPHFFASQTNLSAPIRAGPPLL